MEKPVIAVSMGDPAGVGPELAVKTLQAPATWEICRPFIVGDLATLAEIESVLHTGLRFRTVARPAEARFAPPVVDVLPPERLPAGPVPWGKVDALGGEAAASCLRAIMALAQRGEVQGAALAPMNKEAFHQAGYDYMDELAYMAELTGSRNTYLFGVARGLWTTMVTEHIAFRDMFDQIRQERILAHIVEMNRVLLGAGIAAPRIGVAALNVHGGEGGLYGREEIEEIAPAIRAARAARIDAQGPIPGDALFPLAFAGRFDGVVCMYHDQANIARKLQPRGEGATIFMGLPIPCATTAHGTAFDIAGKGLAGPGSLQAALRYVAQLASRARGL